MRPNTAYGTDTVEIQSPLLNHNVDDDTLVKGYDQMLRGKYIEYTV